MGRSDYADPHFYYFSPEQEKFAAGEGSIYTTDTEFPRIFRRWSQQRSFPLRPVPLNYPTENCMRGILSSLSLYGLLAITGTAILSTDVLAEDLISSTPAGLAPGVLTTIAPELERKDTYSTHDIVELRADPNLERNPAPLMVQSPTLYEMAEAVNFRHDVWCLEFSFKPLRMVFVDIPQANGKMQRKLIWYMVYRVRNTGAGLTAEEQADGTFETVQQSPGELQFIPHFVLSSRDRNREDEPIRKAYLDRIIPAAIDVIKRRERVPGELLNSAEMASMKLSVESGRSVVGQWGVATWEDVDPQIDFFTVAVSGLTNAYLWEDLPGKYQLGDPPGKGRRLIHKKLQLNFWRPGDTVAEEEVEIRFGPAPGKGYLYGTSEGVAYRWFYR